MKTATSVLLAGLLALCGCDRQKDRRAAELTGGEPARGRELLRRHGCSSCHTIPGVAGADGLVGPSLDRIASRTYIAGVLLNRPDNMVQWIKDPPGVDPKTAMPNLGLGDDDIRDIAAYLYTLE